MRRGETQLARMVAGSGGSDLAALRRAAESFYRGSRWEEALKTYDRAALLAAQSGMPDEAFALAFTAASIEQGRKEHAAALDRFKQLAERMPEQSRAGEAHLLAVVNAAALARVATGESQNQQMKAYETLLRVQLANWPDDKSTDQAKLWLGMLLESRHEWLAAWEVYRAVGADFLQYEAAMRGALRCAEQSAATSGHKEVIRFGEELIVGPQRQWPEKWSPLQLEAALMVARLNLSFFHIGGDIEPTQRMLATALANGADAPEAWQSEARLLLTWAFALGGKSTEALAQLEQLSGGTVDGLLKTMEGFDQLAATADAKREFELAELSLHIARRLERKQAELNESQARRFQTLYAAALVRAGHFGDALKLYKTLAEKYPKDGAIHEAHAALLARATDAASQKLALAKWREVEAKTKSGEPRWFRARLAQAELLIKLNDKPAATKLIQLTAVLQPEMGGAEMKARFEEVVRTAGQ